MIVNLKQLTFHPKIQMFLKARPFQTKNQNLYISRFYLYRQNCYDQKCQKINFKNLTIPSRNENKNVPDVKNNVPERARRKIKNKKKRNNMFQNLPGPSRTSQNAPNPKNHKNLLRVYKGKSGIQSDFLKFFENTSMKINFLGRNQEIYTRNFFL